MARFEDAIATVLRHEGGFVNNISDPGGATNYGVSLRWLKTQGQLGDLNHDGAVDDRDIRALTPEIASRFYRDEFWKPTYDRILSQAVATKIFDTAVNLGPAPAHKILQRALNANGKTVTVDGWIGDATIAAADTLDPGELLKSYRALQLNYYLALIAAKPKLAVFERGWRARAAS